MKVFISWSGDRSFEAAKALREWLPRVLQALEPWMSKTDIDAGARWATDVQEALSESNFGILCVTADNPVAPWLLFEAGAIAKTVEKSHVCPYLLDGGPEDIPAGPLAAFTAKRANEEETFELVDNSALGAGFRGDTATGHLRPVVA